MVEQLIDFLQAYKIEMEFKGLDFDADKCTKYTRHRHKDDLDGQNCRQEDIITGVLSSISV